MRRGVLAAVVGALAGLSTVHSMTRASTPDLSIAANAINALGIDLLAREAQGKNALLSPYSIQAALAMTYAGAAGKTRDEMRATLHWQRCR